VCTPEVFSDVMLIKKKINKDKLPSLKESKKIIILFLNNNTFYYFELFYSNIETVTENIAELVASLHASKDYESAKSSDEQGILKIKFGRVCILYLIEVFVNLKF
jgi:hypothetical protein